VFGASGYACPENYNPSDFVLYLLQTNNVDDFVLAGLMNNNDAKIRQLQDKYAAYTSVSLGGGTATTAASVAASSGGHVVSGRCKQLCWLTHRELLNVCRNKNALITRFGISITLNLLYGLIFLGMGRSDYSDNIYFSAVFGAITIVTVSGMFAASQSVLLVFPFERPLFLREYATGTCKGLWFMSDSCV
jgi:hypothetical protein